MSKFEGLNFSWKLWKGSINFYIAGHQSKKGFLVASYIISTQTQCNLFLFKGENLEFKKFSSILKPTYSQVIVTELQSVTL